MPSQYLLAELEAALTPLVGVVKISATLLSAGMVLLFCGVLFGVAAVRIMRWVRPRAWRNNPRDRRTAVPLAAGRLRISGR